jgi:aminoglycoside phosphotransferase
MTEVLALRALVASGLPVPQLVEVEPGTITMTLLPGDRLDSGSAQARIELLRASAPLLRRVHELPIPDGLPAAPDDEAIIRRYREAGGPPLPLVIPPSHGTVFCHGDWTDGNVLAVDGEITGIVDWEAAHVGDPIRELSRAAWGASLKEESSFDALVDAYGADRDAARAWVPIHAAELWLWFAEAGPPEYLAELTSRLLE